MAVSLLKTLFNIEDVIEGKIEHYLDRIFHQDPKLYELTRVTEVALICLLANPRAFCKGFAGGMLNLITWNFSLRVLNCFPSRSSAQTLHSIETTENSPSPLVNMRIVRLIGPIIEELVSRLCIQKSIEWGIHQILCRTMQNAAKCSRSGGEILINSQAIRILGLNMTARTVAILVSSLFFVFRHNKDMDELIAMLPGSFIKGYLAASDGIASPIIAHMTFNTLYKLFAPRLS